MILYEDTQRLFALEDSHFNFNTVIILLRRWFANSEWQNLRYLTNISRIIQLIREKMWL